MKLSSLTYPIRKIYYRIRLFKRFLKYPYYGAWEMVEPMLEIPFEIFCEFYEMEDIKSIPRINIDEEPEYGKEFAKYQNSCYDKMDELHKWWTKAYKQRQEELDTLLDEWSQHHTYWFADCGENSKFMQYCTQKTKYCTYLSDMLQEEEQKFEKEKEENLIKLIKLRNRMWT